MNNLTYKPKLFYLSTGLLKFTSIIFISIFFTSLICYFFTQSIPHLFNNFSDFLFSSNWAFKDKEFGAGAMIYGSFVSCLVALLLSCPLALFVAYFTSEKLSGSSRIVTKSFLEMLAAIPSVVYGLIGILVIHPFIYDILDPFEPESGDTLLSAGLLLSLMILPTLISFFDDSFQRISKDYRDNAKSLGMTQFEVFYFTLLPQSWPGLVGTVLLALGRALGETIAVYLIIGRADSRFPSPIYSLQTLVEPGQSLTSKLGSGEIYLAYGDPVHWQALMSLGLILLVSVFLLYSLANSLLLVLKKESHL